MKIFEGNKYSFTSRKDTQCPAEKFLYRQQLGNTLSEVVHNHKSDIVSKIREIINIHKYRRRLKGKCIEHESLLMSLRLCYEYDINEKQLAENLLLEICICEGNLDTIFSILLPGHVIKSLSTVKQSLQVLYPGFLTKTTRKKSVESFRFYLRKICETREKFDGECDILDRPFEMGNYNPLSAAAVSRDPDMVLILLRFGANPLHILRNENPSDPFESLITGLNGILIFNSSAFSNETKKTLSEESYKGLHCLNVFMRVLNNISFDATTHIHLSNDSGGETEEKTKVMKLYRLHPKLAEKFDYKNYMGVRSLQHLCRLSVRGILTRTSSSAIPAAIEGLPLPTSLKDFLDLQSD